MPLTERLQGLAFSELASTQIASSGTSNRYDNVNLAENSSAVVGNVVHQHFYPSGSASPSVDEHARNRAVEIRDGFSQPQLDAVSDYDHLQAHWLRAQLRIPNTCKWIMKMPEFGEWVAGRSSPILVCIGSMGCGKSILAAAVIDWLSVARSPPDNVILHYYVDAARSQPTTTAEILRALVRQIAAHYKGNGMLMAPDLRSLVKAVMTRSSSMTTNLPELTAIIHLFLRQHPLSFLIVDGIDALSEPDVLVFMTFLRQVWGQNFGSSSMARLMLFSRETLGRRIRLDSIPGSIVLQIKLRHLKPDIHIYVDSQVDCKQQECPITNDEVLLHEVKSVLKSNSEKMFLWIRLQMLSLWDPGITTCDQDIRDQLECLPEGLDEFYIRCLHRINTTNDKRSREIAPRMFRWLASAHVALTPKQAREAVSITPTNLPLNSSQLLSFPVTDYCANLVVLDDLTGTVKFAHSSVKDFLSNADKVPMDLRHLCLVDEESKFWCGRVCLAHAKLHNSRQQVVVFQPYQINSDVASPIMRSILTAVSPFKARARPSRSQGKSFQLPVSSMTRTKASSVADSSLHDYVRQHWLTHTASISEQHPCYADFEDLCLTHDPDLQPWSTTQVKNTEHYRRMVMHAVMTNHAPLLVLARRAISTHGLVSHEEVFSRFAPGTDSTYLHCAATLGHVDAIRVLLNIDGYSGDLADGVGVSARAVALQAQQMAAFKLLLDTPDSDRTMISSPDFSYEFNDYEQLLEPCARNGHLEAVELLLSASKGRINHDSLSSTFFLACGHGHKEIGCLLASYGADMEYFHVPARFALPEKTSATLLSLQLGAVKILETLLQVRRALDAETKDLDLIQIVDFVGGRRKDWTTFIMLALKYGVDIMAQRKHGSAFWWLEDLLRRAEDGKLTYRDVDYIVRLVMPSFCAFSKDGFARKKHWCSLGSFDRAVLVKWLENAADDVVLLLITSGCISCRDLRWFECLNAVFERRSPRVLERILGSTSTCQECDSHIHHSPKLTLVGRSSRSLLRHRYRDVLDLEYMGFGIGLGRIPTLDFLLCSMFEQGIRWQDPRHAGSEPNAHLILRTITAYNEKSSAQYPLLLWVRCYYQAKGDIAKTTALCHELQRIRCDGNFALNFPVGYSRRPTSSARDLEWEISQNIVLSVYGWSFRLNRARGLPFSESDMWYVARLLQLLGTQLRVTRSRQYPVSPTLPRV